MHRHKSARKAKSKGVIDGNAVSLPRNWEYNERWNDDLKYSFRGTPIIIHQSPQGSRVGATVWDICIVMCHFFEDPKLFPSEWFQTKRFIELGSGVGLLGVAMASTGANVVLSDQEKMMPILHRNVQQNIKAMPHRTQVIPLHWGNDSIDELNPPFDVILGSDVTYEMDGIEPLISTLLRLSSSNSEIYIGFQERQMESEKHFIALAEEHFDYEKVEARSLSQRFEGFNGWILKMKKKKKKKEDEDEEGSPKEEQIEEAITIEDSSEIL